MGTEAETRLETADAALTAFEQKRADTLNALKAESQQVGDEYRAAAAAVEQQTVDAADAVDATTITPDGISDTNVGNVGGEG